MYYHAIAVVIVVYIVLGIRPRGSLYARQACYQLHYIPSTSSPECYKLIYLA